MNTGKRWVVLLVIGVVAGGVAVLGTRLFPSAGDNRMVEVKVPDLSPGARAGKQPFDGNCAQCHGAAGAGSDRGPPLVHNLYNPGHHGDRSFVIAARRGVRRHHWNFGDMPAQRQVSAKDIAAIIRYVREIQVANGIVTKPRRR